MDNGNALADRGRAGGVDFEDLIQVVMGASDHLNAQDFADTSRGRGTRIGSGFDRRHIPADKGGDQSAPDFVPTKKTEHWRPSFIASVASIKAIKALVSIMPRASFTLAITLISPILRMRG